MAIWILKIIACLACVYIFLSVGCEYRSYRGGHRYIRAFRAETAYQYLFTLLQCEKDIDRRDMGKLTYLGYAGVVVSTASGILCILFSAYLCFTEKSHMAEMVFYLWTMGSAGWGIVAMLIQGVDSLLNRF